MAADGSAWYTDAQKRAIAKVSSDGTITSYDLATPTSRLGRLAIAPTALCGSPSRPPSASRGCATGPSRGTRSGRSPAPATPTPARSASPWTRRAPCGRPCSGANKLVRIAHDGAIVEHEIPTRQSGPGDVAIDPTGGVWFLEVTANKVGRFAAGRFEEFPVPTPNAGLAALAVAPDGSAWFTALRAHALGRVRRGMIEEFPLPRRDARPFGIAVDRAGDVWYTDLGGWLGVLRAERAQAD